MWERLRKRLKAAACEPACYIRGSTAVYRLEFRRWAELMLPTRLRQRIFPNVYLHNEPLPLGARRSRRGDDDADRVTVGEGR